MGGGANGDWASEDGEGAGGLPDPADGRSTSMKHPVVDGREGSGVWELGVQVENHRTRI